MRYYIKKRTSCMSDLAARLDRIERIVSGKPIDDTLYTVYDANGYRQGNFSKDIAQKLIARCFEGGHIELYKKQSD